MKNTGNTNINQGLFRHRELKKQSFFQRIFRQSPEENAIIQLNNLLADRDILEIKETDLRSIEVQNGASLNIYQVNLEEIYAVLLNSYLSKGDISKIEEQKLAHLAELFDISKKELTFLREELGSLSYRKTYQQVVNTGSVNEQHLVRLEAIAQSIGLKTETANRISQEVRSSYILEYFKQMVADERISPDEERKFGALEKSLKINPNFSRETAEQIKNYKLYWALENLPLEEVTVPIEIQKSEHCYLHLSKVDYYEPRVSRSSYGGTYDKLIESGSVYLTQKRLIHWGNLKNHIIRLEQITEFKKNTDGITIRKLTGKPVTLKMKPYDSQRLHIILKRLI